MLLFDRLVDEYPDEPIEPQPRRVLDRDELLDSIRRELGLLLNTRSNRSVDLDDRDGWTVLDWGLPDFSPAFTRSATDRRRLAEVITHAIRVFEPRLLDPEVHVLDPRTEEHELRVQVAGSVRLGALSEPVAFPLTLEGANSSGGRSTRSADG
jgi:type VI secretion system protein ImpF